MTRQELEQIVSAYNEEHSDAPVELSNAEPVVCVVVKFRISGSVDRDGKDFPYSYETWELMKFREKGDAERYVSTEQYKEDFLHAVSAKIVPVTDLKKYGLEISYNASFTGYYHYKGDKLLTRFKNNITGEEWDV